VSYWVKVLGTAVSTPSVNNSPTISTPVPQKPMTEFYTIAVETISHH
jgi:hypothetical protein